MAATTAAFEAELIAGSTVTNERQQIATGGTVAGGTFTLTYAGEASAAIPFNATAAQIRSALEALAGLEIGDVAVTGGPLPATPVVIEFIGPRGGFDQPQITANGAALTGTSPTITGTTTQTGTSAGVLLSIDRGLMAGAAYKLRQLYLAGVVDPAAHTNSKNNPKQTAAMTKNAKTTSFDAITAP